MSERPNDAWIIHPGTPELPSTGWCNRHERACYEMPLPLGSVERCDRCPGEDDA